MGRLRDVEALEQLAEALAVFGQVNRIGRRAKNLHACARQRHGEVERRLAAELHDDAQRLLALVDVHHVLEGERFEVETVGGVVVR